MNGEFASNLGTSWRSPRLRLNAISTVRGPATRTLPRSLVIGGSKGIGAFAVAKTTIIESRSFESDVFFQRITLLVASCTSSVALGSIRYLKSSRDSTTTASSVCFSISQTCLSRLNFLYLRLQAFATRRLVRLSQLSFHSVAARL